MKYFSELKKSMNFLASKPKVIFLGQAVKYPGTAMTNTLVDIDKKKLIEMPVAEEMQMGISIGMALEGYIPVSFYPRWNFLLLAINQLVNHLDKIPKMSDNEFNPKVIIRTSIGSVRPLDPQCQHTGDFTNQFKKICKNINIVKLNDPKKIFNEYKKVIDKNNKKSSIMVEYGDYYNEK